MEGLPEKTYLKKKIILDLEKLPLEFSCLNILSYEERLDKIDLKRTFRLALSAAAIAFLIQQIFSGDKRFIMENPTT